MLVKEELEIIMATIKLIEIDDENKEWISPQKSPVMFDAWYGLFLWYKAVAEGNVDPLLDFAIDGKYDKECVKHVDPDFGRPDDDNLYLF